jgi:hypothetical protein
MNRFYRIILLIAAGAGLAVAQGPHGTGGGAGSRDGFQGSGLAMNQLQTVAGPVSAVNIGYGMQYPSITINKLQIKVAPAWYLLDKNFEIKASDNLTVIAAPSTASSDTFLYAVELTNNLTRAHIVLRDLNGAPLWTRGRGAMSTGDCTQVQSIATATGVIEQINAGVGIQMATMTVKTAEGKLLVIRLGPERLLAEADLELKTGDTVTVKYALTSHDDELVALAITRNGVTVVLRSDDGRPAWN